MWLFDVEHDLVKVGSRVCIADASDLSGRLGVVCEEICDVNGANTGKFRVAIDAHDALPSCFCVFARHQLELVLLDVRAPLPAPNGLWIQPYCASVPIPPSVLNRRVIHHVAILCCFSFRCLQIQTFGYYDGKGSTRRAHLSAPNFLCSGALHMRTGC